MARISLKVGYVSFVSIALALSSFAIPSASFALNAAREAGKESGWRVLESGRPGTQHAKLDRYSQPESKAAYTPWCAKYGSLCASRAGGSMSRESGLSD